MIKNKHNAFNIYNIVLINFDMHNKKRKRHRLSLNKLKKTGLNEEIFEHDNLNSPLQYLKLFTTIL